MPNRFFFADEAGCFAFSRKPNVSKHFILCTVSMIDCSVGDALIALRRKLAWSEEDLGEYFHACNDRQVVRDAVFAEILKHDFSVQATIMEKSKAQAQVRQSKARFYKYGWFYHFKHGASKLVGAETEALITTASLGTGKEKAAFKDAIADVMRQTLKAKAYRTDFCPAAADPCLQVADYCAWAIQRKWEDKKDLRSYDLIKDRISYEYDLWAKGKDHHY